MMWKQKEWPTSLRTQMLRGGGAREDGDDGEVATLMTCSDVASAGLVPSGEKPPSLPRTPG